MGWLCAEDRAIFLLPAFFVYACEPVVDATRNGWAGRAGRLDLPVCRIHVRARLRWLLG
jgi:hypothetical protein